MEKPLLVTLLGYPGSGKTRFSKQLAERLPAVFLNSDALKHSMFGEKDEILRARNLDPERFDREVSGALFYVEEQILRADQSVVCDAQQGKYEYRERARRIVADVGALAVLVWMQTDSDIAIVRGQEREEASDSPRHTASKMTELISRFQETTELPQDDERNIIKINGELPFDEQYRVFSDAVETIRKR